MMVQTRTVMTEYDKALQYSEDVNIMNRSHAIEWIKRVLLHDCPEARDTCIQIFDKYCILSYTSGNRSTTLSNAAFLGYAAAAALMLSVKLHTTLQLPCMTSISTRFDAEQLATFERDVLQTVGFKIHPNCTPMCFVESITMLSPQCYENINDLYSTVDVLVGEFSEEPQSILFAPSTIAIAALLVSFSVLNLQCTSWPQSIPAFCLPNNAASIYHASSPQSKFLDIDSCIIAFKQVPMLRSRTNKASSPTCVADTPDGEGFEDSMKKGRI